MLKAEFWTVPVEEHLPHYAAPIGEVPDANERVDEYFRVLTKEARDQAALAGVELQSMIRQGHEVEKVHNPDPETPIDETRAPTRSR